MRAVLAAPLLVLAAGVSGAASASGDDDYLDLSLDELLTKKVQVPAALTRLTSLEAPASATVITATDIRLTPARNLYDLIETYVPGAYWMTSEVGPRLGVRGNMANRNYQYLLLVDGQLMNNKAHVGANAELEQWDLGDIERIEIVRGPGSVTYGPGAVAGVISITTRKPAEGTATTAGIGAVEPYHSRGLTVSHNHDGEAYKLFAYASVVRTQGTVRPLFQVRGNNQLGFVGRDVLPTQAPMEYFGDFKDKPQLKAQLTVDWNNGWLWRGRYTQQGSNWFSNEPKSDFSGVLVNEQGLRSRQFSTSVERTKALGADVELTARVSYEANDYERRTGNVRDPQVDHTLNYLQNFAESDLTARAMLNWRATDWAQLAVGAEASREHYGKGWGDDVRDMRIGESGDIVNGPDSRAIRAFNPGSATRFGTVLYVGDGWAAYRRSIFTEANLQMGESHRLLLSARGDKNTYSNWLLSPRAVWIATVAEGQVLKFSAQRAARMNTASQMFADAQRGTYSGSERANAYEAAYSAQLSRGLRLNLTAYRNNENLLSFQGADNVVRTTGKLETSGLEGEVQYSWERGQAGINASHVKLLRWDLAPGIPGSGISYADYAVSLAGVGTLNGLGHNLNNLPNNALKLFGHFKLDERWTVHADARWFGALQGELDGLAMLRRTVSGTAADTAAFRAAYERLEQEGVYRSDLRVNLMLEYTTPDKAWSWQLYGHNLFQRGDGKRYSQDTGHVTAAPVRVRFTEEPSALGLRLQYRF